MMLFNERLSFLPTGTSKFIENKIITTVFKYAASLNSFRSSHNKNKFDATNNIDFDYLIVKGIKAFLQVSHFQAKGKYIDEAIWVIRRDKSKGDIVILGGKFPL